MNYEKILESLGARPKAFAGYWELTRTAGVIFYAGDAFDDDFAHSILTAEIEAAFIEDGYVSFHWAPTVPWLEIVVSNKKVSGSFNAYEPSKLDAYCKAWSEYKGLEL